ncbi:MAG: hypothetical protein FH761_02945 [Firmicutes bacterium]|nr:hypothetical protein [Bacillota bacterium]
MKSKLIIGLIIINIILIIPQTVLGNPEDDREGLKSIEINKDMKINDDVFEFIDSFINKGIIVGDLFVLGRKIYNEGIIHGDILGISLFTEILGTIKGDVRMATKSLKISGPVFRNVSALVDKFILDKSGVVDGSMTLIGNEVKIDGLIGTDLRGKAKTLTITGEIKGNVDMEVEKVVFGTNGKVSGDFNYSSHEKIIIPMSNINGSINYEKKESFFEKIKIKKNLRYFQAFKNTLDIYMRVFRCI